MKKEKLDMSSRKGARHNLRVGIPTILALIFFGTSLSTAHAQATNPGANADDRDARIASDGKRLWLAETQVARSGKLHSRVFALRSGQWSSISKAFPSSDSTGVQLAYRKNGKRASTPCLGFAGRTGKATVKCLKGKSWKAVKLGRPFRGMTLLGMKSTGARPTILMGDVEGRPSKIRIGRVAGRRVVPQGPLLRIKDAIIPNLGLGTSRSKSAITDVAVQDFSGKRYLVSLIKGRWVKSKRIPLEAVGPQISGTVRTRSDVYFPAVDAFRRVDPEAPWNTQVFRMVGGKWAAIEGSPLNVSSRTYSQGGVFPVGDQVWAIWLEQIIDQGAPLPTKVYAAPIDGSRVDVTSRLELWSGKAVAPGALQVVAYKGEPAFLYMKGSGRRNLRATVELLSR
jgi:hypothetical protein